MKAKLQGIEAEGTNKITSEDIKEWKRQLEAYFIPEREYMVMIYCPHLKKPITYTSKPDHHIECKECWNKIFNINTK